MRGIASNGMLCSQKELNIGPDDTHVLVLEEDAPVGVPFAQYYQFDDVVVDIENKALTNRGDLFGILGLAREISAAQNIPFKSPEWYLKTPSDIDVTETLPIKVDNQMQNLCPRYTCVAIKNIQIKESPVWMKSVLLKSGIKPINNVVDITNYLSVITAQPLHAFDYDKLVENDLTKDGTAHITIRVAKNGERIHTLEGNIVELSEDNLVIADSTNPIAIAGVIGSIDTQVDNNTKNIIIESAILTSTVSEKLQWNSVYLLRL
jgi:phenylalanyl-tRNA synthetase beta chain